MKSLSPPVFPSPLAVAPRSIDPTTTTTTTAAAAAAAAANILFPSIAGWTLRNTMDAVLAAIGNGRGLQRPAASPSVASSSSPTSSSSSGAGAPRSKAALCQTLRSLLVSGRGWGGSDTRALCEALVGHLPGVGLLRHIEAVIGVGAPIWNAGDFPQCAALYRAVAVVYRDDTAGGLHPGVNRILARVRQFALSTLPASFTRQPQL